MCISRKLEEIEDVGAIAWSLVMQDDFKGAKRIIKKLRNSPFVSETERVLAIIEAKILERSGDLLAAKERIKQSLGYLWGNLEGFEIISACNPLIDENSKYYYIEILGGGITLGRFMQFTERHISAFDVIANSKDEAVSYIDDICYFLRPKSRFVSVVSEEEVDRSIFTYRGVVKAYPFTLMKDPEEAFLKAV